MTSEEMIKQQNMDVRDSDLDALIGTLEERGFEVEQNKDSGAGVVDIVCKINVHPSLPMINCGFIVLKSDEGGSKDYEDNQFSLRKIQEAIIRGVRSGLDKVYLVAPNEEMAKSVSGKIEWLASFGSLLRLDAISLGIFPEQQGTAVITPSQRRVPEGEKLRKQTIKKREAKIERHSKPKGERSRRENKVKKRVREALLDKHSRPKGQRKRKERR
ncbi:MAG: hypothetical protein M3264_14945 [Thermoproteota archaeon]|nr:hypothetical protein [Thermoproteota archaeon]